MPVSFRRFIPALLLSFLSHAAFAISIPAAADTTTTPRDTLTVAAGKSVVLTVGPTQDALVRFDLSQLPASYNANNVANASLRLYVSRLIKPGDISVHQVIQAWSESVAGPAPEFSATPLATVTADKLATRRFVIVDVTAVVKAWLADPNSNLGLTIISAGTEPTARLTLGSKEGPAVGFPAELQVEIGAGTTNNNLGTSSFIGGGENNLIQSGASFATIPGGMDNEIANNGDFSLAAGRRAVVNHTGSFVWADSTNADFNSTADNQFLIRAANGLTIANDAGGSKVVPVGTRYRDNAIVAWGR